MRDVFEQAQLDRRRTVFTVSAIVLAVLLFGILRPAALGTIALILGLIGSIVAHEAGHFLVAKRSGMLVTEFFVGFGPRVWSFRRGETEYGIKALPLGGYVKIVGMSNLDEVADADESRTYRQSSYPRRLLTVLAGPATNLAIAVVLLTLVWGVVGVGRSTTGVAEVSADSPAAAAGLLEGDRILAIDGTPIEEFRDIRDALAGQVGRTIPVVVERDGETLTLTATPTEHPTSTRDDGQVQGYLGFGPASRTERESLPSAFVTAWTDTGRQSWASLEALGGWFGNIGDYVSNLGNPDEVEADQRFTSPVGVGRVAGQAVESGLASALFLLALINIFLAVFNLLPLPPFDGGHAAVATYERIASAVTKRRVRVDMAKLMPIASAVVLVLAFIGISALYLDLVNPQDNPF
jgi:membrane-associated protease RseP (regulator of RpoE activity)